MLLLLPVAGCILFVLIYIIATFLYPGGSQLNRDASGFSWINNYWCNLLNQNAINGQPNPAKPVAISGLIILALSLSLFWTLIPGSLSLSKPAALITLISGILAMATGSLLFTAIDHDVLTNIASGFGLIATTGVIMGLYRMKWPGLFNWGILNLLLVGINNYLYYTPSLIIYLPIVQKITFMIFLMWVICVLLAARTKESKAV